MPEPRRLFVAAPYRAPLLALGAGEAGVLRVPVTPPLPPGYSDPACGPDGCSWWSHKDQRYEFRRLPLQPGRVWVPTPWWWFQSKLNPINEKAWDEWTRIARWPTGEMVFCEPGLRGWVRRSPATMPAWAARLRLDVLEPGRPAKFCPACDNSGCDDYESYICPDCDGEGDYVRCIDDLCHGQDECIHGDPRALCLACGGRGEIVGTCPACDGSPPWCWTAPARRVA